MMPLISPSHQIFGDWGDRAESPSALAERFIRTIDALSVLHPRLAEWTWGDSQEVRQTKGKGGSYPFAGIKPNIVRAVEANVSTSEDGDNNPRRGYLMMVLATLTAKPSEVSFAAHAGESPRWPSTVSAFRNYFRYSVGSEPDPAFVSYDILRAVMLILAETWEVSWAYEEPNGLRKFWSARTFRCAWMSYLSPRFKARVTPPRSAIVEHRPNGGLFMAATREQFSVDNPVHIAAAREIESALRPLDELPFPLDEPYR